MARDLLAEQPRAPRDLLAAGALEPPTSQAALTAPRHDIAALQDTGKPVEQGFANVNRAIAQGVGGAADLAAVGLDKLSQLRPDFNNPTPTPLGAIPLSASGEAAGFSERPFGGSEQVLDAFRRLGINVDPKPREEQTRSEQIASVAGETLGAGSTFAIPGTAGVKALGAAQKTSGLAAGAQRLLSPITQQFKKAPAAFGATEAGAIAGSAQGSGIAESLAPDSKTGRFIGEVVGGFVSPAGLAFRTARGATKGTAATLKTFSKAGREETASRILQNLAKEQGENPADIARALRAADPAGEGLTSGLKSGSTALQRLEASIARDSAQFETVREKAVEGVLSRVRAQIDTLSRSGDPEQLRQAAKLRQQYFDDLLSTRFNNARLRASEAAANIDGPGRAEASRRAEEALRGALNESRRAEADLWRRVPQKVRLRTDELAPVVTEMRRRILKEEKIPFENTFERILEKGASTSGELITLRSRLLSESRRLRASRDFGMANIASELADGVLRQLDNLRTTDFDEARSFSAALNERFTQTFGGDAVRSASTGGARIAPETLLDRAFAGGGAGSGVKFRQLSEAGNFADQLFGTQVRNAEEEFLRSAAAEVLEDGIANPQKLQTFLQRNTDTLQQFPGLANELGDARNASFLLREAEAAGKTASKAIRQKAAFSRLLDIEDATPVVGRILNGPQPAREIAQLARLAQKSGPGATAGLRTAILDSAFERAGGIRRGGFVAMDEALKQPLRGGTDSVSDLIRKNNLMDGEDLDRFTSLIGRAAKIETDAGTKFRAGELIDPPDALTDIVVRTAGARLAAPLGEGTGSSLIAASAGSRATRRFFQNFKGSRVTDILIEAAEDPAIAAKLLERPRTEVARNRLARQLNTFLINAGILNARPEEGDNAASDQGQAGRRTAGDGFQEQSPAEPLQRP